MWPAAAPRTQERPPSQPGRRRHWCSCQLPLAGSPGAWVLSAATLVGSAVALGTSGLPDSGGGFWWFAGSLSRATPRRAAASTRRVAQKPKAEVLEPQSRETHALHLRAPCGLPAQRWWLARGPPRGLESLGAGACLWPTQLLGRWPATLVPEALPPLVLERPDQACSRIHPPPPSPHSSPQGCMLKSPVLSRDVPATAFPPASWWPPGPLPPSSQGSSLWRCVFPSSPGWA